MLVNARSLIRKMRGGAQAHLLQCDDGHAYVVKFRNNPQHRRVLVNEWISSVFLEFLEIAAPPVALVNLTREFLDTTPEVCVQLGSRRIPVDQGWHFGSRYPGDPARVPVYDFLPDMLLEKVENPRDFLGILAFDKWMGNADSRQAIFYRARLDERLVTQAPNDVGLRPRTGFVASMVDHGYVFDGPHWSFPDSPLQGLYHRPLVYRDVRSFDDFQPWLDRIVHFPEQIVDQAWKQIPPAWIEGDEDALDSMLAILLRRRPKVPDLIRETASRARVSPFPNWR